MRLKNAYESTAADRAALSEKDLMPVRVDVVAAVVTTLGCIAKIAPYRETIAEGIRIFDLRWFDELETYALAFMHSHARHTAAAKPPEAVEPLSKDVVQTREVLLADVTALEARKLVDGRRAELRGPIGYKNQASDVLHLVNALRDSWPKIAGKSAVTAEELDRAEVLADRLLTAIGEKEQGPKAAAAQAEERSRAYTLFVRAHDEVRRVMSFLRWHDDDLDAIFPTVFGGKSPKSEASKGEAPKEAATSGPSNPSAGGSGVAPAAAAAPIAGGLAGSDPFVK